MKRFIFMLEINEDDVTGDEVWEDAVKKDGTEITDMHEFIAQSLIDSNLLMNSNLEEAKQKVKLVKYTDE